MPVKAVSGPRCMKHQIECTYNCGWCGKPICEECLEAAYGKKYCEKCWAKKQQMAPAAVEDTPKSSGPRTPIRNVDHSLDAEQIEQHRAVLGKK